MQLDKGLSNLNKKLDFNDYSKILEKTLIHKASYGEYFKILIPKKKTIFILTDKNSNVISKDPSFTYNDFVKSTLKKIRKNGFDFQIEDIDYEPIKNEYYAVFPVAQHISSKEFCFRVGKLMICKYSS